MRLFVAVWPPPEVVDVLGAFDRPEVAGVRWTSPSQWHVTLRFLGEVPDESVGAVETWLRSACVGLSPVRARLGDATARFGRGVLHVPVDGLSAWAAAVSGEVAGVPLRTGQRDGGAFVGHVTLARARGRGSVARLAGRPLPPGARAWSASAIALVRSRLASTGSEYSNVVNLPIG